jgi:hypothetical protein
MTKADIYKYISKSNNISYFNVDKTFGFYRIKESSICYIINLIDDDKRVL